MPLVSTKELLLDAQKRGYAVGAFNVENMEMAQAVVWAAEEAGAPVILQTTSSTLKYADPAVYYGIVYALAKTARVPVVLHLDHGNSPELAARCMEAGYPSVMIDGSQKPFEQNIAVTRLVVDAAQAYGVPVEAELGQVGGKEDDLSAEQDVYTDPAQAAAFVARTGADSLAVAIGTAHGIYHTAPVLDKKRLSDIRRAVSVPLILHGASGLADEDVRDCISRGACKVNFATELRIAFTNGVKSALLEHPDAFDPKVLGKVGRESVFRLVLQKISVCGSAGKG